MSRDVARSVHQDVIYAGPLLTTEVDTIIRYCEYLALPTCVLHCCIHGQYLQSSSVWDS